LTNRDTGGQAIKYRELKQLFGLPGVEFENVKVSRAEVRGDIVTCDRISGIDKTDCD